MHQGNLSPVAVFVQFSFMDGMFFNIRCFHLVNFARKFGFVVHGFALMLIFPWIVA